MMRAKSSIDSRILHGLAGAHELGNAVRIEAVKLLMVVSVIMMPADVDAEIVAAVDQPGHAVHDEAVAVRRRDIEDDVPALPVR